MAFRPIPTLSPLSRYTAIVPHVLARVPGEVVHPRRLLPRSIPAAEHLVRPRGSLWYALNHLGLEIPAARRLWSRRPWLLHLLHGEGSYHYLGLLARRLRPRGGRLVCTFHQPPEIFDHIVSPRAPLEQLDAIVVFCATQAEHIAERVGWARVHTIPHGIDTEFWRPAAAPGSPTELICVGSWLRDFTTLEAVARRLAAEYPEIHLSLVTRSDAARRLEPLSNVSVLRGLSDEGLRAAYRRAGVLVLPLRDATANCALLEAMACGLAVVATRVGGVPEHVTPDGAVLVPRNDATAMVDALVGLAGDPALAAQLGARNRARALELDLRHAADALVKVYRGLWRQ